MKKKFLSLFLAVGMTMSAFPVNAAALTQEAGVLSEARAVDSVTMSAVTVAGKNYYYVNTKDLDNAEGVNYLAGETEKSLSDLTKVGDTSVYYTAENEALLGTLYGVSTLSYSEYYAKDTSVEEYDAVSSATTTKNNIFPNEDSTEPEEEKGYQILGVKNVPVAVEAEIYVEAQILKAAGVLPETGVYAEAAAVVLNEDPVTAAVQYKTLLQDGSYSATSVNVADTVKDAEVSLNTSSRWGDYELDVKETSTNHIRNSRDDNFDINSQIQGVILEATDGTKVGLRYTLEIWVQPYEVSFDVDSEAGRRLIGKTVNKITYVMPNAVYVYEFKDGAYIKPQIPAANSFTAAVAEDFKSVSVDISGLPKDIRNPKVTVSHKEGRTTTYYVENAVITDGKVTLTEAAIPNLDYNVIVSSDNYADIQISVTSPLADLKYYTAVLAQTSYEYDGKAKQPSVTIEGLAEGTDFTVSYKNNVNAGTATVVIEGMGNYTGKLTKTFEIKAKPVVVPEQPKPSVKVKAVKKVKVSRTSSKKMKVSWKKSSGVNGYEIQYSLKKNFKKAVTVKVKKASKTSKVISNLKAGKRYYVRVRAYKQVSGLKYCSEWSARKTVKSK